MFRVVPLILVALCVPAPSVAGGSSQAEGRAHKGPRAYHEMCRRDVRLCAEDVSASRDVGHGSPAVLSDKRYADLERVNSTINRNVESVADAELYGVSDFWTLAGSSGDCEDFMIAKKRALLVAGWKADQLLYAVVEGVETPYHAVLVVRTDQGDLVLDNLTDDILAWQDTGYRFIVRQSADAPSQWVRIRPVTQFVARAGARVDANRSRP